MEEFSGCFLARDQGVFGRRHPLVRMAQVVSSHSPTVMFPELGAVARSCGGACGCFRWLLVVGFTGFVDRGLLNLLVPMVMLDLIEKYGSRN